MIQIWYHDKDMKRVCQKLVNLMLKQIKQLLHSRGGHILCIKRVTIGLFLKMKQLKPYFCVFVSIIQLICTVLYKGKDRCQNVDTDHEIGHEKDKLLKNIG